MFTASGEMKTTSKAPSPWISLLKLSQESRRIVVDIKTKQYSLEFYSREAYDAASKILKELGYDRDISLSEGFPYIELKTLFLRQSLDKKKFPAKTSLLAFSQLLQKSVFETDSKTKQYRLKFDKQEEYYAFIAQLHKQGYKANTDFVPAIDVNNCCYIEPITPFLKESLLHKQKNFPPQTPLLDLSQLLQDSQLQRDDKTEEPCGLKFNGKETYHTAIAGLQEQGGYKINEDFVPIIENEYRYIKLINSSLKKQLDYWDQQNQFYSFLKANKKTVPNQDATEIKKVNTQLTQLTQSALDHPVDPLSLKAPESFGYGIFTVSRTVPMTNNDFLLVREKDERWSTNNQEERANSYFRSNGKR